MTDAPTSGTAVTASGTSVDFTGIPSTAKRITVMFSGVSTSGTSSVQVQLGDSGGVETTGYAYAGNRVGGSGDSTGAGSASAAGFVFVDPGSAASIRTGLFVVANFSGNTWAAYGGYGFTQGVSLTTIGGTKTLSDTLTQVRITTVNGTDTFDAGTINILYE